MMNAADLKKAYLAGKRIPAITTDRYPGWSFEQMPARFAGGDSWLGRSKAAGPYAVVVDRTPKGYRAEVLWMSGHSLNGPEWSRLDRRFIGTPAEAMAKAEQIGRRFAKAAAA